MTAYRVKWRTANDAGELTGIWPNQSVALRMMGERLKGATVVVTPMVKDLFNRREK